MRLFNKVANFPEVPDRSLRQSISTYISFHERAGQADDVIFVGQEMLCPDERSPDLASPHIPPGHVAGERDQKQARGESKRAAPRVNRLGAGTRGLARN